MQIVREAYRLLDRRAQRSWLFAIPLTVGLALLEGLGLALLLPVIQVIADGDISDTADELGWAADLLGTDDAGTVLGVVAAVVGGLFLLKSLLGAGVAWWQLGVMTKAEARLANRLFEQYVRAPVTMHRRMNSSEPIRALNSSINAIVRSVLLPALIVIGDGAVLVSIAVVLLIADPVVSLVTGIYLVVASGAFVAAVSGVSRRLGRLSEDYNAAAIRSIQEGLDGVKTIQATGAESYITDAFAEVRRLQQRQRQKTAFLRVVPRYYLEVALVTSAALVGGVAAVTLGGDETLAYLSLLVAATLRALTPAGRVVTGINTVRVGGAGVDIVKDAMAEVERAHRARRSAPLPPIVDRGIRLDGVGHAYEDGRVGLHGVELCVAPGESLGVVGSSGSGKSTLAAIIAGLIVPTQGVVRLDGVALHSDSVDLFRHRVGFVPQSSFMTDEPLRNNVAFGIDPAAIDDGRVVDALRDAGLAELLTSGEGIHASFGENGARLSGGQRQRVSIARALYRGSDVLVLDEATASLDTATEARLLDLVDGLAGRHTVIRITHRLAGVRTCDRVVLMADGRVVDIGSYRQLQQSSQAFRSLVELERV